MTRSTSASKSLAAAMMVQMPVQTLQRQCACGQHTGGGECSHCAEERDKLQRHGDGNDGRVAAIPRVVDAVLRSQGAPLDAATRRFMEPRFGRDFSGVQVHTDARAAESARSVNALAYTVGRDIVFGAGQYAPHSSEGRRLLAHELAHTMQQGDALRPAPTQLSVSSASDPAEREAQAIGEKVGKGECAQPALDQIPQIARQAAPAQKQPPNPAEERTKKIASLMKVIHGKLTSFLFNAFVKGSDVAAVLQILEDNPDVFDDLVSAMEQQKLVDRLFSKAGDAEKRKYAETLRRVQNARVHVSTVGQVRQVTRGSCTPEDKKTVESKVGATKERAAKSRDLVDEFVKDPQAGPGIRAGKLLERYFFHSAKNPPGLTPAVAKTKAQTIRDNFDLVSKQANPLPNQCANPDDLECSALAAAYVTADRSEVRFCRVFFTKPAPKQTYLLSHELTHVYAGVSDHGYGDERVFSFLPVDSAIDNADSYALFSVDVEAGKEGSSSAVRGQAPGDNFSDCDKGQKDAIQRSFAFGARMVNRALGALGESGTGAKEQMLQGWSTTHFNTTDASKLQKVTKRYQDLKHHLRGSIDFECESKCSGGDAASYYYKFFGSTVHVCPAFFAAPPDNDRADLALAAVMAQQLGMKDTAKPWTPAYAAQSFDQHYNNVSSFTGYAREVTQKWGI